MCLDDGRRFGRTDGATGRILTAHQAPPHRRPALHVDRWTIGNLRANVFFQRNFFLITRAGSTARCALRYA